MTQRKLEKAITKIKPQKPRTEQLIPAILGVFFEGQQFTSVPNRHGFVFVRIRNNLSEVVQVFNESVVPAYGLPVLIVRDPVDRSRYRIVGRDLGIYSTSGWGTNNPYYASHGDTHSFDGGDTVWVYGQQFLPFLVYPGSVTGSVQIYPYTYHYSDSWFHAGSTGTSTLLTYKPTGSSARMVLVYSDYDGNPQLEAGTSFFAVSITGTAQVIQHLPDPPADCMYPLAGVRLLSGTSIVGWPNLYDVRPFFDKPSVTGSSGGGSTTVTISTGTVLGAYIQRVANQTVPHGTGTPIIWDTETIDDHNFWDNSAPTKFVVSDDGWYILTTTVDWATDANGQRNVDFKINNVTWGLSVTDEAFGDNRENVGEARHLSIGDYVEVIAYQDSGGDLTCTAKGSIVLLVPSFSTGTSSVVSGGGSDILIYDDNTFKTTGTAIHFNDNLDVIVSGTSVWINGQATGGGGGSSSDIGAQVSISGDITVSGSVFTYATFDTEAWDTNNIFVIGNPTKLTCNTAGKYILYAGVRWGNDADLTFLLHALKINGNYVAYDQRYTADHTGYGSTIFTVVDLNVGDYAELELYSAGAAATVTASVDAFGMQLLNGQSNNTVLIYDDNTFKATGTSIHFNDNLSVIASGTSVWVNGEAGGTGPTGPQGDNTILIYDDDTFSVTGTALHFNDNLSVVVSGSSAWIDGQAGGETSTPTYPAIYDDHVFKTTGTSLDFVGSVTVSVTGTTAYIQVEGVTGSAGATGATGPAGAQGAAGANTTYYDDSIYKVTGTAVSFDDNLDVHVTGTIAYVDVTTTDGIFLMSAMRYYDGTYKDLLLLFSKDGKTWNFVERNKKFFTPADEYLKDPSITFWNNTYWVCYSAAGVQDDACFGVAKSSDLYNWEFVGSVGVTGSIPNVYRAWAPEWFIGPNNDVHVSISCNTSVSLTDGFITYELHPLNDNMTAWSNPEMVTGTFPASVIDARWVYVTGTYFLWYKDNAEEVIEYCSSNDLLTGYVPVQVGDWAGWGTQKEAPTVIQLQDGSWRMYMQHYDPIPGEHIDYSDSSDGWATWTTPSPITSPWRVMHGTQMLLYDLDTLQRILTINSTQTTSYNNPEDIGARVYSSIAITGSNTTWFPVPFDSERYDTDNLHNLVTNPSRFVCNTAGTYLINGQIVWDTDTTGERYIAIRLNSGTAISQARHAATTNLTHSVSTIYPLVIGDYVELWAWQDSGGDRTIRPFAQYAPEFMTHLLYSQDVIRAANTILIYEDNVFKTTGSAISFDTNFHINVTGSVAYISVDGVTGTAGAAGAQGPAGPPGGNTVYYDNSIYKITGSAVSFDDGLSVSVTGTTAFVKMSDGRILLESISATGSSVTFSNIPSTYNHLAIDLICRSTTGTAATTSLTMSFNGDTTDGNYRTVSQVGNGSTTSSGAADNRIVVNIPTNTALASNAILSLVDIPFYKSTIFHKNAQIRNSRRDGATSQVITLVGFWWESTNAITSVSFAITEGNFVPGSTFNLYGVY